MSEFGDFTANHPLAPTLALAVPLRILALQARGGPTDTDRDGARAFADVLAAKGDVLQFGGGKRGEAAALFNDLAQAIAVMAFGVGGVRVFGMRFEVSGG